MSVTTELRDMLDAHGIEVMVHRPMTKAELAQENAKLRELVRDMVDYGEGAGCGMAVWFADRMRELGVEVDDD